MDDEFYAIGVITGARGLKGEVKVKPLTDHPERFANLKTVFIGVSDTPVAYNVERVRSMKNIILIQFRDLTDRISAEKLVGSELLVNHNELVELHENEYFWFDLIGMDVYTVDEEKIGHITRIIEGPANDIYVVQGERGETLIPAVTQVIKLVDTPNKKMIIDPLPGLINYD